MYDKEKVRSLREQCMTYQQIANEIGCSIPYVYSVLGKGNNGFKVFTKERCIYVNIRNWLNEHQVSLNGFIELIGLMVSEQTRQKYRKMLNGSIDFCKFEIDKVLEFTGMSYDEAFIVG